MDGLYVFNNPWSVQSMEKQTTYCAMMRLGLPIPETWMVPPKDYEPTPDLEPTLQRYARALRPRRDRREARLPDVHEAVRRRRLGGREPHRRRGSRCAPRYEESGKLRDAPAEGGRAATTVRALHRARPADARSCATTRPRRCTTATRWTTDFVTADERPLLRDMTLTINASSAGTSTPARRCRKDGVWYPIDFANACPDSQVTSLHYHFPWLVKANIRWAIFCAATKRRCARRLDWEPFFDVAAEADLPYRERLRRLRGDRRASGSTTTRFEEFCAQHLAAPRRGGLGVLRHAASRRTPCARRSPRCIPRHEIDEFTELFWRAHPGAGATEEGRTVIASDTAGDVDRRDGTPQRAAGPRGRRSRAGARSARRCCSSRPRAATPRRSSAS